MLRKDNKGTVTPHRGAEDLEELNLIRWVNVTEASSGGVRGHSWQIGQQEQRQET